LILKNKKLVPILLWRSFKWHVNYLLTRKPFPISCGLYITNNCNFKCSFCNIWRSSAKETLTFDKAKELVDRVSELGCFYFSISGGEPLLVDYIFDFIDYVKKSKIKYLHMVTNGYLLDADKARKLGSCGIDEISISIDGHRDIHDYQRGMVGAYDRAINAIEHVKRFAPKVKIVLNAVIFPENIFECLHAIELAHKFDIYAKVQPLNQHPLFNRDDYAITKAREQMRGNEGNLKRLIKQLREDKRVINSKAFLENIYNFYYNTGKLIFKGCDCVFGYHSMEVLQNGKIFPCLEGMNWQNGFDFSHDLRKVMYSDDYIQALKQLKKCNACQNNYYVCYYESRIAYPLNNFLKNI